MNFPRLCLALWLASSLLACSAVPNFPAIPFGSTFTPTPPPTATATLAPTPSPTPIPILRVEGGDRARFNGDYAQARAEYQLAYDATSDPEVRAAALWGLARTEVESKNPGGAIQQLNQLIGEYPDSVHTAQAQFLLGEIYIAQQKYSEAAVAYQNYLTLRPGVLDAYAYEYLGDAFFYGGDYVGALNAYKSASLAPRLDMGIPLQVKIGQTYAALGDYFNAIAYYDAILQQTNNDYIKAQLEYLAGSAYLALGQPENAHPRFQIAVENYPLSIYAYNSLVELVNAGVEVSELDRGLVDYFAAEQGATGYDVALAAFDRYLASGLDADGTARFYRALTLEALGREEEALAGYNIFIGANASNVHWTEAWSRKASIQWQVLGDYVAASQTLRDFAVVAPTDSLADDYLMDAARLLERDNRLEEAATVWEQVVEQYPGGDWAADAIFLAGIARYRMGDYAKAQFNFERGKTVSIEASDQARTLLWVGKAQEKQGQDSEARKSWEEAARLDPTGYYSERALDLLLGRAPFAPPSLVNMDVDLESERAEAAAWVRLTFGLPSDTDLSGPGPLTVDPRFTRGAELWELGLYDEARLEFESLRGTVDANPADSFRLANYLIDIGLYRPAIFAARQVLTLAGLDDQSASLQSPPYFKRIRYGLYYRDLIESAAQGNGFEPLFLFSVVRQESLFEGFVRSTAGARGLMQIIPSTGASVAAQMGWPYPYQDDLLYQPNVSIALGTHYLASNRGLFDGNLYAALAAYNGGPGNASAWLALAPDDPDLYLEVIRFAETRNYIRGIYEIYNIYLGIYSPVVQ
ncbi:MAG: Outer membrane protein assembly factor BamD [Anaerolineales bacterium]|nr:Outer membrane protein assembly factor BamD [Anaerolineales bacterium]